MGLHSAASEEEFCFCFMFVAAVCRFLGLQLLITATKFLGSWFVSFLDCGLDSMDVLFFWVFPMLRTFGLLFIYFYFGFSYVWELILILRITRAGCGARYPYKNQCVMG